MNRIGKLAVGVVVFLVGMIGVGEKVMADTTFTVNSTEDLVDLHPGDGVCETTTGNGVCTLRAAVQETNALVGNDTINLPAGIYDLTISGVDEDLSATGDLDFRDNLILNGDGANDTIIRPVYGDRIINLATSELNVSIVGVTVEGSNISRGYRGGAIYTGSNNILTLRNCKVQNNSIQMSGQRYYADDIWGAGVYSGGTLTVDNCLFRENHVSGDKWSHGGAISGTGTFIISNSLFEYNTAVSQSGEGGAIYMWPGSLSVSESTFRYNSALAGGGAYLSNVAGIVDKSTFYENGTGVVTTGGAIAYSSSGSGVFTVLNSTISSNHARGNGGGILQSDGTLYIVNSTLAYNTSAYSGSGNLGVGTGYKVNLVNTILVKNGNSSNCNTGVVLHSLGHNISNDTSCGLTGVGDIQNINPYLGSLDYYGGTTLVYSLTQGSLAIGNADSNYCPVTDQRGVSRPQGTGCDIGAFEAEPFNQSPVANTEVDQVVDEGSEVIFNGLGSSDPDGIGDIVSYSWDFGDGSVGSGVGASHVYIDDGVYTATLTVMDSVGHTANDSLMVTVNNVVPTASLAVVPDKIIQGQTATLIFGNQYDPGSADTAAGFGYAYDCQGDGIFEVTGSTTSSYICSYTTSGVFIPRVRITDKDGGYSEYTASVTVQTPAEAIGDLINVVANYNLQQGIDNSLDAKLSAAADALTDLNQNNDVAAINSLQAFINAVEAQRGNKITSAQADTLIQYAQEILQSLG